MIPPLTCAVERDVGAVDDEHWTVKVGRLGERHVARYT